MFNSFGDSKQTDFSLALHSRRALCFPCVMLWTGITDYENFLQKRKTVNVAWSQNTRLELGSKSLWDTPVSEESASSAAVSSRWSAPPACAPLPAHRDSHSAGPGGWGFSDRPASSAGNRQREQTVLFSPLWSLSFQYCTEERCKTTWMLKHAV